MRTESYSRLWGYGNKRATADWTPFQTDADARKFRDELYKAMKKRGVKVKRSTLPGQTRPYWGLMDPCGDSCTVYELHFEA